MIDSPPGELVLETGALSAEVVGLLRRHELLRPLLQRMVVAAAVADVIVTPEESNQLLQNYANGQKLTGEADLTSHLETRGLSLVDLRWHLELPVRVQRHCGEHFTAKAEQRFLERKNQLDQVVYSLLRVKDAYLAQELYLRIASGEANFADLAAVHAEGPERRTKGIVGPVPLTRAHPVLAERLRTSSPGVLLEPIRVADWWLVVRLENYTPANFDEATAQRMAAELFDQWVHQQVDAALRRVCQDLPMASPA